MDSPESNPIALTSTSSAVQDSPIFSYLSNLSPIEQGKPVKASQGFSELNFPPPPPVFTSPRINQQRETSFLKRPQNHRSSSAGFSLHDNRPKILTAGPDVLGTYANQSTIGLIPCTQRECDSKNSAQIQPCSPSGCIDEYLADPVEDCANSDDLCLKQANDTPQALQSGCTSSKETITKLDDDNNGDIGIGIETEVAASLSSLEQAKEDLLWKSLFHVKPVEIQNKQSDGGRLSDECQNASSEKVDDLIESNLSLDLASGTQNCNLLVAQVATKKKEHDSADVDKKTCTFSKRLCHHRSHDVKLQNAEGGQQNEWDCTPQLLPESLVIVQTYEYCDENLGAISNGSVENRMSYDLEEASQHQRGMRRRLQFEAAEAHRNTDGNSLSSSNTTTIIIGSRLPASPTDLEILDSSHVNSGATSSNRQPVNLYQPITSGRPVKTPEARADMDDGSVRSNGNSPITAPIPSGIGLHLNSIANSVSIGCGATGSKNLSEKDYLSVQAEKSVSVMRIHLPEDLKSTHCVVDNLSAKTNDARQESQATVAGSSATFQSPHSMKSLNKSMPLKLIEHDMTQYDKKKSASENADTFEEFNQLNSQKKRKKAPNTVENEGCKRCNCRKSKCLKLYCDCFAAGVYCDEPCACQSCLNKPEYEDTVSGVRQQILSRNPLAFAPKIVKRFTESPANSGENGNRMTPSSARHKRGCNCKKSMCQKKYCECYQANVGCSDGCRCEGCKNIFGAKEGYGEITEMVYKRADDERREDTYNEKLDMMETRGNLLHPEQCHPHNLTPLTPSIQCTNYGKDVPDSRLPARRYLPSPESDAIVLSSFGQSSRSPRNSNNHDRQLTMSEVILDIVSYDQEFDCSNAENLDQFMPRWDGHADVCHITPLSVSHPPSRAMASLASSSARDSMEISRAQSCHGSGCLSSSGSLRWRSSPITPMPQLDGRKFPQELDPGSGLYHILEDDTPEILKDTPTPIKAVKVTSPNRKRISPPHSRLHELTSSSSPSLRSGRKFILQAMPSFPSLTPYGAPKSSTNKEK